MVLMALPPIDRQHSQPATSSPPAIQKTASQFNNAAQQAKTGSEVAKTSVAHSLASAVKPNLSKLLARSERDKGSADQHHGKRTMVIDGVRVTTEDGQVTRVKLATVEPTVKINDTAGHVSISAKDATSVLARKLGEALPSTVCVILAPRSFEDRSSRKGEKAGNKAPTDFGATSATSVLDAETSTRVHQNNRDSSGGGDQQGRGDQDHHTTGGKRVAAVTRILVTLVVEAASPYVADVPLLVMRPTPKIWIHLYSWSSNSITFRLWPITAFPTTPRFGPRTRQALGTTTQGRSARLQVDSQRSSAPSIIRQKSVRRRTYARSAKLRRLWHIFSKNWSFSQGNAVVASSLKRQRRRRHNRISMPLSACPGSRLTAIKYNRNYQFSLDLSG
jgi:hypothetical protein